MPNNRNLIPAWLMKAAAWFLGWPGIADLLVITVAIALMALGAGYE